MIESEVPYLISRVAVVKRGSSEENRVKRFIPQKETLRFSKDF